MYLRIGLVLGYLIVTVFPLVSLRHSHLSLGNHSGVNRLVTVRTMNGFLSVQCGNFYVRNLTDDLGLMLQYGRGIAYGEDGDDEALLREFTRTEELGPLTDLVLVVALTVLGSGFRQIVYNGLGLYMRVLTIGNVRMIHEEFLVRRHRVYMSFAKLLVYFRSFLRAMEEYTILTTDNRRYRYRGTNRRGDNRFLRRFRL